MFTTVLDKTENGGVPFTCERDKELKVGLEEVAISCGVEIVIPPLDGIIIILFAVPFMDAAVYVPDELPINTWPDEGTEFVPVPP